MIVGLVIGLTIVVTVALFVGGIAVGCWLENWHINCGRPI